jgi:hypothetical protein
MPALSNDHSTTDRDCGIEGCPIRNQFTSHYHCAQCLDPQPTSYMGHHVGGNHPEARIICDRTERVQFLREIG